MKNSYDFSKGKRGRIIKAVPEPAGKVKITIRLDRDVVDHFLAKADESGAPSATRLSLTRHCGDQ